MAFNMDHRTYASYDLSVFANNIGTIITDSNYRICIYDNSANLILGIDLSKYKNLGDLFNFNKYAFENKQIEFLSEYDCSIRRDDILYNDSIIFHIFPSTFSSWIAYMNTIVAEYEIIFEQSSDGIFITDGEGIVLNVNPSDEKKCMMKREEMIGKNVIELENRKIFYPSTVLKVLETKSACTMTQTTLSGQNVICTGTPIFDKNQNITRVLVNNVDYTEMIHLKENLEITEKLQKYYLKYSNLDKYKKFFLEGFYVKNEKMLEILNIIENMSEIDPTVLICGDSGVGKSLLAKKIHLNSPKKSGNFIEINCGAIPTNLLESELFGYTKGAFTGANSEGKIGLIEMSNNGTLFLDEIGDLPIDLQVKLLHVIQNRTIRRLGSNEAIDLNIRIISASNKDLASMVKNGIFREDLYYRLNVVPLSVPSLKERTEEIPELLDIYLKHFNSKYNYNKKFHPKTIYHLINYSWPGNIRELINIVERLLVTSLQDTIMPDTLPPEIVNTSIHIDDDMESPKTLQEIMETVEKDVLIKALEKTRSSYEIAKLLNIGQSSVMRKLQKYKLDGFLNGKSKNTNK